MAEILLVHPRSNLKVFGGMPPLGMAGLAAYAESRGFKADLADLEIDERDLKEVLADSKPRIVGIGGTSHSRHESFRLARAAKEYDKDIAVVYGGPHASFTAEDTLRNVPEIDAVVRGEGESAFLGVVERTLRRGGGLHDIDGVSWRRRGGIVHNKPPARREDLDALPPPKRSPEDLRRYGLRMDFLGIPGACVVSSRGCPVHCSFCSAGAMFGKKLTLRSAGNVVDEIEELRKAHGIEGIKFFDSTLTLRRGHVESICREIRRRGLQVRWECEIRVDTVDKDLLRTMRDAGCYYVDFGVESASPRVLRRMRKGIRPEQAERVLSWCRELGLLTKVFFTFGHIGETPEDSMMTVRFIEKHAGSISSLGWVVGVRIYPGTLVERHARETGCLGKDFSWTGPFHDADVEFFGKDPCVPMLIQPQMGYGELRRIRRAQIARELRRPAAAAKAVGRAWRKGGLRRLWMLGKGMLRTRLN